MNELSLFSGAGGGVLGSKILGWKTLGYVEWESYCQKVIAQRIKDGIFDEAPIFGDIKTFVSEGYARSYRGMVDVVSGGFPCQPFSVAGSRKAGDDSRDMWPATLGVIKAVEPPIVFLENVPGLLSATMDDESGRSVHYFGTILRDLAESGYDAKWCVLGADDVGAPHHRKRLWILGVHANAKHNGSPSCSKQGSNEKTVLHQQEGQDSTSEPQRVDTPRNVADTKSKLSRVFPDSASPQRKRRCVSERVRETFTNISINSGWEAEPSVGRVADGMASRANRLTAIGNGQVPITMAAAYAILSNEFAEQGLA